MDVSAPVVETALGSVSGKVSFASDSGSPVFCYLGIPYAAPPVGNRRFSPPEPAQPWQGIRDGSQPGPPAPQNMVTARERFHPVKLPQDKPDEACLYLNIYTPGVNKANKRPVMFHIHGGALAIGMGDAHDGTALATYGDVVVVTLNYRLGVLGFLSTGDATCPGNFGILDQIAGLRWVNENIANFGGDPQNVTIFGVSAGALSVEIIATSSLAKGLFHKAICQSGSILIPGQVLSSEEARSRTMLLANALGCKSQKIDDVLRFLRNRSVDELRETHDSLQITNRRISFLPVIDGHVISTTDKKELLEAGQFVNVPRIIGFTSGEGFHFLLSKIKDVSSDAFTKDAALGLLKVFFRGFFPLAIDEILELVRQEYFSDTNSSDLDVIRLKTIQAIGDALFVCPGQLSSKLHSDHVPTFQYVYTTRVSYRNLPSWTPGADHADDQVMVWGDPLAKDYLMVDKDKPYSTEETRLSLNLMKYWTNFARTGDPNGDGLPNWPRFDKEGAKYLEIGEDVTEGNQYRLDKVELWTKTIPLLEKRAADR